jgi:purine-binding chemotaxis protein CheW
MEPKSGTVRTGKEKLVKLLTFSIGKLNIALHIDCATKIINSTAIYGSGLNHLGLAHIGDKEITVVDLHKRLFRTPLPRDSETQGYLILAKNSQGEDFGILTNETPTLVDVPLADIRLLPDSYRHADTLVIASHVAVIPQPQGQITVFLLDVDQIVPRKVSPHH